MQLAATVSSLINGGRRVTPHFWHPGTGPGRSPLKSARIPLGGADSFGGDFGNRAGDFKGGGERRFGENAAIEGYSIGGKTATSETIPRSAHRYISSFLGFTPAENPTVLGICVIHNPQGVYYGGTVAAPVIRDIFANILPYLGVERTETVSTETEAG